MPRSVLVDTYGVFHKGFVSCSVRCTWSHILWIQWEVSQTGPAPACAFVHMFLAAHVTQLGSGLLPRMSFPRDFQSISARLLPYLFARTSSTQAYTYTPGLVTCLRPGLCRA